MTDFGKNDEVWAGILSLIPNIYSVLSSKAEWLILSYKGLFSNFVAQIYELALYANLH